MPVLGCFQGRAMARGMCTTRVYHSGGAKPLQGKDSKELLGFQQDWRRGGDRNHRPSVFPVARPCPSNALILFSVFPSSFRRVQARSPEARFRGRTESGTAVVGQAIM